MHDLREIVNAILYVCRTGIAWEYLPHDFPPYKTVYDYYAKWEADGTTETLHDLLRQQVRVVRGRARTPTAAIIDSQSVKTSCNVAETSQGIDAGKKIKGRKRHIATDALGLLLVAIVTAASVQDSAGGHQVLDQLADRHPRISKVWVDGGYNNTVIRHGARNNMHVEVIKRPTSKGFHVLPRRLGGGTDAGLADAAPKARARLRNPAPTLPGDDPLGQRKHNEPFSWPANPPTPGA